MSAEERRCPRCCLPLERYQRPVGEGIEAVSADMCITCGGIWHDGPEISVVYPEVGDLLRHAIANAGISQLDCPVCQVGMGGFMVERISLDVCRSCSGLWIDGDEVLALEVARAKLAEAGETVAMTGGYRTAARTSNVDPEPTTLCAGCGKEVAKARTRRTADGDHCQLCFEHDQTGREAVALPESIVGRALRRLLGALRAPCDECGLHDCEHRLDQR